MMERADEALHHAKLASRKRRSEEASAPTPPPDASQTDAEPPATAAREPSSEPSAALDPAERGALACCSRRSRPRSCARPRLDICRAVAVPRRGRDRVDLRGTACANRSRRSREPRSPLRCWLWRSAAQWPGCRAVAEMASPAVACGLRPARPSDRARRSLGNGAPGPDPGDHDVRLLGVQGAHGGALPAARPGDVRRLCDRRRLRSGRGEDGRDDRRRRGRRRPGRQAASGHVRLARTNRELSELDALTGVGNLRALRDRMTDVVKRAPSRQLNPLAVAIDLDEFKQVNDVYSHTTGDQVLVAVARAVSERVRIDALVARRGGDEFVVVLDDADPQYEDAVVRRIDDAIVRAARAYAPSCDRRPASRRCAGNAARQPTTSCTKSTSRYITARPSRACAVPHRPPPKRSSISTARTGASAST